MIGCPRSSDCTDATVFTQATHAFSLINRVQNLYVSVLIEVYASEGTHNIVDFITEKYINLTKYNSADPCNPIFALYFLQSLTEPTQVRLHV